MGGTKKRDREGEREQEKEGSGSNDSEINVKIVQFNLFGKSDIPSDSCN